MSFWARAIRRIGWFELCVGAAVVGTAWHAIHRVGATRPVLEELRPFVNVGGTLAVPELVGSLAADRTVVLLLDVGCPACLLSRPFYSDLGGLVAGAPRTRFVVLTEDRAEVATQWLSAGEVQADVVQIASRKELGFVSTPTLLLVDQRGVVTDIVRGIVGSDQAERFKRRVLGRQEPPLTLPFSFTEESVARLPGGLTGGGQLLDVRPADAFAEGHAPGAVHIPASELARAVREFQQMLPISLDCRFSDQAMCRVVGAALGDLGFVHVVVITP